MAEPNHNPSASALVDCPKCGLRLFHGTEGIEPHQVKDIAWCPRCKWRKEFALYSGALEVEYDWLLRVELTDRLSVDQVGALRRVDPSLQTKPLGELLAQLRGQSDITLGPFSREEVDRKLSELSHMQLVAHPIASV